ncbi:prothoracicotropic hormone-like [Cydia strobilella]|uniref:prothoracicotropic hormone-like n=1 Tax=Cydia strobilella TaxID=1100964 RepID=UPI00300482A8
MCNKVASLIRRVRGSSNSLLQVVAGRQDSAVLGRFNELHAPSVSKVCVFILVCLGVLVAIQSWLPRVSAKQSDLDAYMVDARSDLRNYVVGLDYPGDYGPEPDRDRPAPLPEFIVDYANMIRNDIILLDNSVETRTRKRGNIKVKKHSNVSIL